MIWMIPPNGIDRRPRSLWRLAHDTEGSILAQETHQVASQFDCWLQEPIRIIKKDDILHAQNFTGCPLLALTNICHFKPRRCRNISCLVRATARGIRANDIVDIPPFARPGGNRASRTKLGMVWMSDDDHRHLLFLFAHK